MSQAPRIRSVPKNRDKPRVLGELAFQRQVKTRNLASQAAHNIASAVASTPTTLVYEGASGDQTVKIAELSFTVAAADSAVTLKWFGILEWNQGVDVNAEFYAMLDGAPAFTAGVEQNHIAYTKITGNANNDTGTPFLAAIEDSMSIGAHVFSIYGQQDTNPGGAEAVVRAGHFLELREDKRVV